MALIVYNTASRKKEEFHPARHNEVCMFVCGPTVYDLAHVGHAKTYTQFDFIVRCLRYRGYRVTYVQNITDIDDKIIARAAEQGVEPAALAEHYEGEFRTDMRVLHNIGVNIYARAHDYIDQMVDQVRRLIDRGHAYRLDDGWYYDLSTFPDYGKLSGRSKVRPGDALARIDQNDAKRSSGDFALWKFRKPGEPYWSTSLGQGRPGWHIEDTAITEQLFGPKYDVHGGAVDLVFPHHEAEIAQMAGASGAAPLVRHWMHTGLLNVGAMKMGKSAGNSWTVREALRVASYRTIRYAFISHHYRAPMELTGDVLAQARSARHRVERFARSLASVESPAGLRRVQDARRAFFACLDDDFDTSGAMAVLFRYVREQNKAGDRGGPSARDFLAEVDSLFDSFGLGSVPALPAGPEQAVKKRERLRREGRYAEADQIRQELSQRGIVLEDASDGTTSWYREAEA